MATGRVVDSALPRFRVHTAARRARLRRVRSRDFHDLGAGVTRHGLHGELELVPAFVPDRPVEPGLGPHAPAGLGNGARGRPGHVLRAEVLEGAHRVTGRESMGGSSVEVVAAVACAAIRRPARKSVTGPRTAGPRRILTGGPRRTTRCPARFDSCPSSCGIVRNKLIPDHGEAEKRKQHVGTCHRLR